MKCESRSSADREVGGSGCWRFSKREGMKQVLSRVEMRIYQGSIVLGNVEFWGQKFK